VLLSTEIIIFSLKKFLLKIPAETDFTKSALELFFAKRLFVYFPISAQFFSDHREAAGRLEDVRYLLKTAAGGEREDLNRCRSTRSTTRARRTTKRQDSIYIIAGLSAKESELCVDEFQLSQGQETRKTSKRGIFS
jgi:hypothetical protein